MFIGVHPWPNWFSALVKNSWIFPLIEAIHLVGVALLAGTIALSDYQAIAGRAFAPFDHWTRVGLLVVLATGPMMFFADRARYLHNPAFLVKMAIVAIAFAFHWGIRRRYQTRWAGILSLAMWTAVVLSARAIADFDLQ